MEFEQQIKLLDEQVNRYYSNNNLTGLELLEIAKKISGLNYYLTTVRAEIHDAYQCMINEATRDKKMSVARAENDAHVAYPAMYKLRHKLDASYEVLWDIRNHLSYLKKEMSSNING